MYLSPQSGKEGSIVLEKRTAIVIDESGNKKTSVLVKIIDGEAVVQNYTLGESESLVYEDVGVTIAMRKPRWNGRAWEEAGERVVTEEMVEALRSQKLAEVSAAAGKAITGGATVETSQGEKHFSLTAEDQMNMSDRAQTAIALVNVGHGGEALITYHADGDDCRAWTPEEFIGIFLDLKAHIIHHQTYCNQLNMWIRETEDYHELQEMYYGIELPDERQKLYGEILEIEQRAIALLYGV